VASAPPVRGVASTAAPVFGGPKTAHDKASLKGSTFEKEAYQPKSGGSQQQGNSDASTTSFKYDKT
jgi:hypothetical protein